MKDRIRQARESAGFTVTSLAKEVRIDKSSISSFESGRRNPSPRTLTAIADACKVSEEWLRTGEGPMRPEKPPDEHYDVDSALLEIASETELTSFELRFVKAFLSLTPQQRNVFEQMFQKTIDEPLDKEETLLENRRRERLHEEVDREIDLEKDTPGKSSDSSVG